MTREKYLEMFRSSSIVNSIITTGLVRMLMMVGKIWALHRAVDIVFNDADVGSVIQDESESMECIFLTSYQYAITGGSHAHEFLSGEIERLPLMRELFIAASEKLLIYYNRFEEVSPVRKLEIFHTYLEQYGEKGFIHGYSEEISNAFEVRPRNSDPESVGDILRKLGISF